MSGAGVTNTGQNGELTLNENSGMMMNTNKKKLFMKQQQQKKKKRKKSKAKYDNKIRFLKIIKIKMKKKKYDKNGE